MQYYELYEGESRFRETDEPEWDDRYDVIVSGGGSSGTAAIFQRQMCVSG